MKNHPDHTLNAAQIEALQARFAQRVSMRLDDGAQSLPHDITERLRVARAQAVRAAIARHARVPEAANQAVEQLQVAPSLVTAGHSPVIDTPSGLPSLSEWPIQLIQGKKRPPTNHQLGDDPVSWGWKLAAVVPAAALLLGLWGIHTWYRHEKVQATTEVDMALLTDDLPPAAYTDPGFEEYLRSDTASDEPLPGQEKDLDIPELTESEEADPKGVAQP